MTQTAPTPVERVLHFILPVVFLTMSAVFLAVPYGMGKWPGDGAAGQPDLLACAAEAPGVFRGT